MYSWVSYWTLYGGEDAGWNMSRSFTSLINFSWWILGWDYCSGEQRLYSFNDETTLLPVSNSITSAIFKPDLTKSKKRGARRKMPSAGLVR
jgi:hypothetical protein